jgi:methyltransferase-like protein
LPYLDGKHDRAALAKVLVDAFDKGTLSIHRDGVPVTDRAELDRSAEGLVEQTLNNYAFSALLAPQADDEADIHRRP